MMMEPNAGVRMDEKTRRSVWDVELDLLIKFDEFCKKYDLRYMVDYGTMLGTVRHKGFIPWDDDVDVMMLRPDYNRMLSLCDEYFEYPYYMQHYYKDVGIPTWGLTKLMNEETACIENREIPEGYHSGIFMDIFVYDDVLMDTGQDPFASKLISEVYISLMDPGNALKLKNGTYQSVLSEDMIRDLYNMPFQERARLFDSLLEQHFGETEKVAWSKYAFTDRFPRKHRNRHYYDKLIYMPFDSIEVPISADYDKLLRHAYGDDYMTPKPGGSAHRDAFFDPYKSYKEYLE